jgi:hypothetical protein
MASILLACTLTDQLGDDQSDVVATSVAETLDSLGLDEATPEPADTPLPPVTEEPILEPPRKIVYTDNKNLWIIEFGSPPKQLTFDGNVEEVRITTDGMRIAFTRSNAFVESSQLYAINPDGTDEALVLSRDILNGLYPSPAGTAGFDIGQFEFRPHTHQLFFNTLEVFEEIGYWKTDDLFRQDFDSGELTAILPAGAGGEFLFSPDGNKIAIIRPDSISVVNGDGADYLSEIFTYSPVLTYSEFQYYAQPVWFENSRSLGVALPSDDPLAEGAFGEIWRIPVNGDPPVSIGIIDGDFYFTQVFSTTSLSPELNRVAFMRETNVPNQRELYLANTDGSEQVRFEIGAINWKGWAPDGFHFVYSNGDPTELIIASDGGAPLFTIRGTDLLWISDDEFLVISGTPGDWSLRRAGIDESISMLSNPEGDFIDFDISE